MGYKGAAPSLGFYDNLKDPLAAIRPDLEKDFNETLWWTKLGNKNFYTNTGNRIIRSNYD